VTISAPLASTAARVSVQIAVLAGADQQSRTELARANVQIVFHSASSDRNHDFESIAVVERGSGMLAARDDLAVALDGDPLARCVQALQQAGDRGAARQPMSGRR
jgi:hypothetical protein